MKVKELKRLLEKCDDEREIGISDLNSVYQIEGISVVLFGALGIDSMLYALRTTQEVDVVEISTSLIKDLQK